MINFDVYVEELAELIRHVDSKNELGAVTLAEKIVADGFLAAMLGRSLWVVWAWIMTGVGLINIGLMTISVFLDSRFTWFFFFSIPAFIAASICTGHTYNEKTTWIKKPKGWRKLRRDAEREAYIRKLEREAGMR